MHTMGRTQAIQYRCNKCRSILNKGFLLHARQSCTTPDSSIATEADAMQQFTVCSQSTVQQIGAVQQQLAPAPAPVPPAPAPVPPAPAPVQQQPMQQLNIGGVVVNNNFVAPAQQQQVAPQPTTYVPIISAQNAHFAAGLSAGTIDTNTASVGGISAGLIRVKPQNEMTQISPESPQNQFYQFPVSAGSVRTHNLSVSGSVHAGQISFIAADSVNGYNGVVQKQDGSLVNPDGTPYNPNF